MNTVGLFKSLLIICYDGLLLLGVVFLSSVFFPLLPEAFNYSFAGKALKGLYLTIIIFLFYGWFWTHGGQTLGMKVWKLYLVNPEGKFIDWKTALLRFIAAMFSWAAIGLGFTWILVDRERRTWHDIISGSRILHIPNPVFSNENGKSNTAEK